MRMARDREVQKTYKDAYKDAKINHSSPAVGRRMINFYLSLETFHRWSAFAPVKTFVVRDGLHLIRVNLGLVQVARGHNNLRMRVRM